MTQTRTFLLIAWLFVAGWLWLKWTEFSAPPTPTPAAAAVTGPAVDTATAPTALPAGALPGTATPVEGATPALPGTANASVAAAGAPVVRLRNDVLELAVDARGNIVGSRLLGYRQEKKSDSPSVELLRVDNGQHFVAGAGFIALDASQQPVTLVPAFAPVGGADHTLPANADSMRVALDWTDAATGLRVRRNLVLARGSYLLTVEDSFANGGAASARVYPFVELERTPPPPPPKYSSFTNPESFSFVGAAWYTPEGKFDKTPFTDFTDEMPPATDVKGGWIGMLQHHFLAAWVPVESEAQRITTETVPGASLPLYRIRSVAVPLDVAPGAQATHRARLWVGPKLQKPLAAIAPGLKASLDYGKFTFIAQPLFDYVLKPLHFLTGNWGWAIILTVLLLKLALYPLSAAQFRSMAKLRAVQPRIEALKERHGEDRQAFQMAMMDLYKKEKINPVGGCLPLLIPLPIFFALYWVLLETVELRQAPWIGWIQNLTAPDPYFILPVLNLVVMYLTQKMTPTPGMDPMQKKMMQAMPLVFGVMMAFFPAGLVLYWVTNGLLGLLQQWWIARQHGAKAATPAVAR